LLFGGLCNEIGGQNPPAYKFAENMLAEAKRLDPGRLCTYASNSLQETPEKDAAGLIGLYSNGMNTTRAGTAAAWRR